MEGSYKFNCKYSPEIYSIGIKFKEKFHLNDHIDINTSPISSYKLKTKIMVENNNNIIYSKTIDLSIGRSFSYDRFRLAYFNLYDCNNSLTIDFIDSEFKKFPKDSMNLYVRVYKGK